MASTSINKKGIADFLWEWAESNGDWGKLLVDKIVRTEASLRPDERQDIFNYFLQSVGLASRLPALWIFKPTFTPTAKEIKLTSLSKITGVNCLAKNQTLSFGPNITVIYGENGSGKTGYSRILKSLGFSYDPESEIVSNVHTAKEPKHAIINFEVDSQPRHFVWSGNPDDPDLQNISIFNSHCVQLSLADRHLIVAPIGFHLFNLVTSELQELQRLFDTQKNSYKIDLPWSVNLSPGTLQQNFIASLHSKSSETTLNTLSSFGSVHQNELDSATQKLLLLNKALLENEIRVSNVNRAELEMLVKQINISANILTKAKWELFKDCVEIIKTLQNQTQIGLAAIALTRGIEFYESAEFLNFIKTAEKYIDLLGKEKYPSADDICVYCRQPLDATARQLLADYRILLNETTQEKLDEQKKIKAKGITIFAPVDAKLVLHQPTFGLDEDQLPVQPELIVEYNEKIVLFKEKFLDDSILKSGWVEFDFKKYLDFLQAEKTKLDTVFAEKQEILKNLGQQELDLKKKIAELNDRKMLSSRLTEIKTVLSNLRVIQIFKDNSSVFNTGPISRKTSEAREELVRQNFNSIFQQELLALRKADIKIELQFGTERGHSKVMQRIKTHIPADILSEGEQKAIALAEFLTELQLDNIQAPVVFDDPVNSLDHRIIDEVAKRLIRLSETRQVIVFTHSILLMNSFLQQKELQTNRRLNFELHGVRRNFDETGCIHPYEEANSFNFYTGKLNALLNSGKTGKDEEQLAAEGYGHLRAAIEICVEDDILKSTIKRYRKGVAFPSLLRIDGAKIESFKTPLNDIYEKCCVSIEGHSSPTEIHTSPTIAELKSDYDAFKKIRTIFNQS